MRQNTTLDHFDNPDNPDNPGLGERAEGGATHTDDVLSREEEEREQKQHEDHNYNKQRDSLGE